MAEKAGGGCPMGFGAAASGEAEQAAAAAGQAAASKAAASAAQAAAGRGSEPSPTYDSYLALDLILSAQHPRSNSAGDPHHDELLFIVIHQTYELWFKQVLHEVSSVLELFASPKLDDTALSLVEQRMGRVNEIFKILADQFRVLLTMSPDQFLSFRKHLGSSSGFQSLQFRTLELKLGLRDESRAAYAKSFRQALGPLAEELRANTAGCPEGGGSLVQLVDQWLSRMPFLKLGSFDWWVEYEQAANKMFDEDERRALSQAGLSATEQSELRARMAATRSEFGVIFQEEEYNKQGRRLSYPAFKAALLINLYHDEPILQVPFQVLLRLIEVDEGLSNWRWRHATMVKRMLGSKLGTGGSGGYSYLQQTTSEAYRVFSDLSNISTYMLPKDSLPSLPSAIESAMGFAYVDSSGSPSPKRPRKQ